MWLDRQVMNRWVVLSLSGVFYVSCLGSTRTADGQASSLGDVLKQWQNSGPYCGLYDIYAAARMTGRRIDFVTLVKPEYLSSHKGSSLQDLLKAAQDNGFHAQILRRLTIRDLRRSPYMMILYVKATPESTDYDHYELFVGGKGNAARIVNPPVSARIVSFRELVPRWSGDALVLSSAPLDLRVFDHPRQLVVIACTIVLAGVVVGIRLSLKWLGVWMRTSPRWLAGLSAGQAAGLGVLACVCGIVYHIANDAGFLVLPEAVSTCQKVHAGGFLPKIDVDTTRKLLRNGARVVDARMPPAYHQGHLEGAINVPVSSTQEECLEAASSFPDGPIVVYCQSTACRYAEKVAVKLVEGGYSNIYIFKGGWNEWVAKTPQNKEPSI
jgi:rhodanese-related sulfurtransferase